MFFPVNSIGRFWVAAAVAMSFYAGGAQAYVGNVGAKQLTINKLVQDKRIRDQVDAIMKAKQEQRVKAAAARAAADKAAADKVAEQVEADKNAGLKDESVAAGPGTASAVAGGEAIAAAPVPALVIAFNKNHVNFDKQLRTMVQSTERSKRMVHYSIISEIPAVANRGRRNERVTGTYENNLNLVLRKLNEYGVQASRVTVTTKPSESAMAQTVSIFQD